MSHIKKQSSSSSSPSLYCPPPPSHRTTPRPRNPHVHRRDPNHHLRVRIHIRALRIQQRHDRARARIPQREDLLILLLLLRRGHHHQRCIWRWWRRWCRWRRGLRGEVVDLSGRRDLFDDDGGVDDAHLAGVGDWARCGGGGSSFIAENGCE